METLLSDPSFLPAIITSHNIVIVHNQLIRYPDIAFFTSPIPLHIAAMVILYGHMSRCDSLPKQVALEDVWMALDMLPRFRWRWERKDLNGGHPLIAKLAERVIDVNLHQVEPPSHPVLMSEQDWDTDTTTGTLAMSVQPKSQQTTPTMPNAPPFSNNGAVAYGPQTRGGSSSGNPTMTNNTPPEAKQHLVDVPAGLFFPFFPENQFPIDRSHAHSGDINSGNGGPNNVNQDFTHLLAAAAAQPDGAFGHASHDSFVLEERDPHPSHSGAMPIWMNVGGGQRGLQSYAGA
jgi:hypothetical protein